MKSLILELPAMYADHHVVEVKRILSELPGIGEIYASSAFQSVEIKFDPNLTNGEEISHYLKGAGYLDEIPIPVESGAPNQELNGRPFFRHSTSYTQNGKTIGFAQDVPFTERPLWPCPGMGLVEHASRKQKEEDHG